MDGWRCPGCGRCYSPMVPQCAACDPSNYTTGTAKTVVIGEPFKCAKCGLHTATLIDSLCSVCYGRPT